MPMKIALIGPTYPYRGGISHYTTLLFRHLRGNHEVCFWSFRRQYPAWLFPGKSDKEFGEKSLREIGIRYTIDSLLPHTWMLTAKQIVRFEPEIVVLPWWVAFWGPIFFILLRYIKRHTDAAVVYICHNVIEHEAAGWKTKVSQMALGLGNGFLVHSDEEAGRLQRLVPGARVKRVFHPIYSLVPRKNISRQAARKKVGVSGPTVLFFGFVRPYKGLEYLIEAFPQVLKSISATLLIVGEFWQGKEKYLSQIQKLGIEKHVKITDAYVPTEEIETYFAAANVLAMPYVAVTGSGVVQMAFYFGLPVIVTDVGMLPQVVRNGETGFVVPSRNPAVLAKKIVQYFEDGLEETFRQEIEREKTRFSWNHIVQAIEEMV